MTPDEHAFLKLGEECSEVRTRIDKLLQFGPNEKEPGQDLTNLQRLRLELADVSAAIFRLHDKGLLDPISGDELVEHILAKDNRVDRYLQYSIQLGRVSVRPEEQR
jgi:hypothetical protein